MVIAGPRGSSGKTILTLGIIGLLRERGLKIASFKKGPDYIDAGWLALASGRNCYNLDPYLFSDETILWSFLTHSAGADCALIEGNRGIYDGMDPEGTYSTAELAKLLRAPVILVVDCAKVTRTLSAMIKGIVEFDRDVAIRGVVLNNLSGPRHEAVVRDAVGRYTDVEVVGALHRVRGEGLSERHMGLTACHEHPGVPGALERIGEVVGGGLDWRRILDIARGAPPLAGASGSGFRVPGCLSGEAKAERSVRIGVVKDRAFQFYYPDNLEALSASGAVLTEIDALKEGALPPIDALYIGGGFPETNAVILSENRGFMDSLRQAVEEGLPVYAECGGLMYLGREIEFQGRRYPMAGVLPLRFRMEGSPAAHGYTEVEVRAENPFFPRGCRLRGHEFHYSRVVEFSGLETAFAMRRGKGIDGESDGIVYRNVLATYTHLHALGSPEWIEGMIRAASGYRTKKGALLRI